MAACVIVQNLTLGHNSHSAVHHRDGIVRPGDHLPAGTIYIPSISAGTRGCSPRVRHISHRTA
ncbi:MAG: hypothetical protein E5X53_05925 [Mesorhizobium sp.]|uniref:hypothetical protein n=1 Tax=Mesorhizobium sp. TaxID=1871066 RepID=UPI000FE8D0E4|nr:hypothetical protein [Mesorhizobium sp.]RWM18577.1 MAG: hypothetical protein EOR73_18350 [Mesorhizobium sp.]TIP72925.1 MAG: hypothetical protein E5X55_16310 [Mesorhizobium sp.]TIQ08876.1 MAG: hypothetical protein E5X57_21010 [Mesorhizobium sp.]TIR53768.1 MAG: hypothetical protein E5X53_05925 [Mesorhizobium sp.]TJV96636.1 MAG: hypothetical protein E5X52_17535 [Mesorhizobium sp.]